MESLVGLADKTLSSIGLIEPFWNGGLKFLSSFSQIQYGD